VQGVGAHETARTVNKHVPIGVLLIPEEWDVCCGAAVVKHVAHHLRNFDVAVVGARRGEVPRRDALGVDVVEESLLVGVGWRSQSD